MRDVEVIDDPAAAVAVGAAGAAPGRAGAAGLTSTLAAQVGPTRQRVNYHLRTLEAWARQLVREQRRRGLTERVMRPAQQRMWCRWRRASRGCTGGRRIDSRPANWRYARVVSRSGDPPDAPPRAGLALSLDTQVRFRSAVDRARFTRELADALAGLAARYHDADAPGGRAYRLIVVAHPFSNPSTQQEEA
jgi:hypothetical protein